MHTNTLGLLAAHPAGLWERGALMLCMRELHTVAVVDIESASVKWWWGGDELSGPHQPSMLPDGRVLVFDNGTAMGRTRLVVVEPTTREVVWSWAAEPPESFFCPLAGGCERLPNGNLLVTNSTEGIAFELAMDGRVERRLSLPAEVYGAERGGTSIYRMSAVRPDVVARLRSHDWLKELAAAHPPVDDSTPTTPIARGPGCAGNDDGRTDQSRRGIARQIDTHEPRAI